MSQHISPRNHAEKNLCLPLEGSVKGGEPTSAEEQAWAEGGEKNRLAFAFRQMHSFLQSSMQRRTAHRRSQIPARAGNRRKSVRRDSTLFRKKSEKTGIRLVRSEASNGRPGNAAALFHGGDYFFQARDCGAGEGFAVKLYAKTAFLIVRDLNGRGILASAAKQKIAKAIG